MKSLLSTTISALAVWGVLAGSSPTFAQDTAAIPLQPFAINHELRVDSDADVRFLLNGPAGQGGFIQARDGHLFTPDGNRFRCWGVNMTGWAIGSEEIPDHAAADTFSAELARLGVNCVRLHFLDMEDTVRERRNEGSYRSVTAGPFTHRPRGLVDGTRDDTQHFNPERLERLDYWISKLKEHGIYVDFNLNVGRSYKSGDGVPDFELVGNAKGMTYFGPELIALQKDYARQLLGHTNPYTGLRYADDPAVAIVEVVNENSILEFWLRNWLRGERVRGGENLQLDTTPHYQAILDDQYNAWLRDNRTPAEIASLRAMAGVAADAHVPFMRLGEFADAPKLRLESELNFLTKIETGFHEDFRRFLRDEVGVKSPIVPLSDHTYFTPNQPQMRTASQGDIVDSHVYWQHPAIYGRRNEPMVNSPQLSIIQKLARSAMVGKPFTVSEVNHPYPSDYGSEMIPILASYAAFQDWDGIFFYTFETKIPGEWTPMIGDHFDITQDPVKMAQMPVGAMIFLRGDVAPARTTLTRSYSSDQITDSARLPRAAMPYYTPGFDINIPLTHGSRVSCLDCRSTLPEPLPAANPIVSDTGQLSWLTHEGQNGLLTINTPLTQALVGFVRANQTVQTRNLSAEIGNTFATITLSSLDGKPITTSDRLLLTTTGKVENTGAEWDERRAMLTNWGVAPTVIEPITGWIQLKDLQGALGVFVTPLDGSSRPIGPEIKGRMIEPGWEIPVGTPVTTSYLIRVER